MGVGPLGGAWWPGCWFFLRVATEFWDVGRASVGFTYISWHWEVLFITEMAPDNSNSGWNGVHRLIGVGRYLILGGTYESWGFWVGGGFCQRGHRGR